jgi:hypothetical protein
LFRETGQFRRRRFARSCTWNGEGPLGDDVCPGAEITFTSEHISKVTTSDRNGSYQLDLPAGLYTMTARYQILIGKTPHYMKQTRPLFRASSSRIVLNVRMFAEPLTCDIVVRSKSGEPPTSEQLEEGEKNLCDYEDQFAVPASDGTPYQLVINIRRDRRSPEHTNTAVINSPQMPLLPFLSNTTSSR